jgi:hypothetical protein
MPACTISQPRAGASGVGPAHRLKCSLGGPERLAGCEGNHLGAVRGETALHPDHHRRARHGVWAPGAPWFSDHDLGPEPDGGVGCPFLTNVETLDIRRGDVDQPSLSQ